MRLNYNREGYASTSVEKQENLPHNEEAGRPKPDLT